METQNLTPEKSFELITQVINEAKSKFEENGFIYIFWGILIALASLGQFLLLKNEYYDINYYPYFLMPFGGLFTGYYFYKKKSARNNQISKIVGMVWVILTFNMLILAFLFAPVLKENLTPILLVLMGVGIFVSGGAVNSKLILVSGIFINISGFVCFQLDWIYHSLLMSVVSVIAVLIPGVILMVIHRKKQNV